MVSGNLSVERLCDGYVKVAMQNIWSRGLVRDMLLYNGFSLGASTPCDDFVHELWIRAGAQSQSS